MVGVVDSRVVVEKEIMIVEVMDEDYLMMVEVVDCLMDVQAASLRIIGKGSIIEFER